MFCFASTLTTISLFSYFFFQNNDAKNISLAIFGSSFLVACISILTHYNERKILLSKLVFDLRITYNFIDDFLQECAISKNQFNAYYRLYDKLLGYNFTLYQETDNTFIFKSKTTKLSSECAKLIYELRKHVIDKKIIVIGTDNATNNESRIIDLVFNGSEDKNKQIAELQQKIIKELKDYVYTVKSNTLPLLINKIEKSAGIQYKFDMWNNKPDGGNV